MDRAKKSQTDDVAHPAAPKLQKVTKSRSDRTKRGITAGKDHWKKLDGVVGQMRGIKSQPVLIEEMIDWLESKYPAE